MVGLKGWKLEMQKVAVKECWMVQKWVESLVCAWVELKEMK